MSKNNETVLVVASLRNPNHPAGRYICCGFKFTRLPRAVEVTPGQAKILQESRYLKIEKEGSDKYLIATGEKEVPHSVAAGLTDEQKKAANSIAKSPDVARSFDSRKAELEKLSAGELKGMVKKDAGSKEKNIASILAVEFPQGAETPPPAPQNKKEGGNASEGGDNTDTENDEEKAEKELAEKKEKREKEINKMTVKDLDSALEQYGYDGSGTKEQKQQALLIEEFKTEEERRDELEDELIALTDDEVIEEAKSREVSILDENEKPLDTNSIIQRIIHHDYPQEGVKLNDGLQES